MSTALLHIKSHNRLNTPSLADFWANSHFHWLSHTVAHAKSSLHLRNTRRYLTPQIHCFLNTGFFTVTPGTNRTELQTAKSFAYKPSIVLAALLPVACCLEGVFTIRIGATTVRWELCCVTVFTAMLPWKRSRCRVTSSQLRGEDSAFPHRHAACILSRVVWWTLPCNAK
jgi:hypothetical protein